MWTGKDSAGDVDHLKIFGSGQGGNIARTGADVVIDRGLKPRNPKMSS